MSRCILADRCHCPDPVYRGGRCREHWEALSRGPRWKPGELEAARAQWKEATRPEPRPKGRTWAWVDCTLGAICLRPQRPSRDLGAWVGRGQYASRDAAEGEA